MSPFLLCLCILCLLHASKSEIITIQTKLGKITGNVNKYDDQNVYEFLGINYALPPIGDLRFRPAQLNTSWQTTYNATKCGPMLRTYTFLCNFHQDNCSSNQRCIQPLAAPSKTSEDCLNLNIWTPNINPKSSLSVMIWIYGGGYVVGSNSDALYEGTNFILNTKDTILVSINYRLGALGFLSSQQLFDEDADWKSYGGLNGFYDQIQAIKWIKAYISDFGGDPNKITIFGQSAGGTSICMLLISPMVPKNLFQRAIIESGSCLLGWGPLNTTVGIEFSDAMLGANGMSADLNVLRSYPAHKFTKFTNWSASVDQLILTDLPDHIYANLDDTDNVFNAEQVIMGYVSMDGTIGFPWGGSSTPNTEKEYGEYLEKYITNETQIDLLMHHYYPLTDFPPFVGGDSASVAWQTINGDVYVSCPTILQMTQIVQGMKNTNGFRAYLYEFVGAGDGPPKYAEHGAEVPYIFDHRIYEDLFLLPWNQNLSNWVISSFANFGRHGIPNITDGGSEVVWRAFDEDENAFIWDTHPANIRNYASKFRHDAC